MTDVIVIGICENGDVYAASSTGDEGMLYMMVDEFVDIVETSEVRDPPLH